MADESIGSLVVNIVASLRDFEPNLTRAGAALRDVDDKASNVSKSMGISFGSIAKAALKVASVVGAGLGFKAVWDDSMETSQVLAQMDTVLKSTGSAAGMTKDSLLDLANSQSMLTTYSANANTATENLLLTFTNIGQKVFPDALKITNDMSIALGQDTKSSAIQLGKALNDPIVGITALSRVGVSFTQGQKDQIKAMQAAGNVVGAQKIIMAELTKEFGGSAEAAGKTLPGQLKILKNTFLDVGSSVLDKALPNIQSFTNWITTNMPKIKQFITDFSNKAIEKFKELSEFINVELLPRFNNIVAIVKDIAKKYFPDLVDGSDGLETAIKNLIKNALDILRNALIFVRDNSTLVKDVVKLLTLAYIAHEAILLAVKIKIEALTIVQNIQKAAMVAYRVVMALATAAQWGYLTALESGNIALGIIAAAQWLFNAALDANPIGVVILAIAGLGAGIYELVKHWNDVTGAIEKAWDWLTKWNNTDAKDKNATTNTTSNQEYGGYGGYQIGAFADGINNFQGGMALVGEKGPEILRLPKGSSITPNKQTEEMLGQGVTNHFNIANMNVRDDNDIHLVARELFNLQKSRSRGSGVIAAT